MKKLVFQLVLCLICFFECDQLVAQSKKYPLRTQAPKGTYVSGSSLKAKKGYTFKYTDAGKSTVALMDNNGTVEGEFHCDCETGGSCEVTTSGTMLNCNPNGCSSCIMIIVDNQFRGTMMKLAKSR